jgi:ABC-type branched-subunit amino acid transport system substrate-binding protein
MLLLSACESREVPQLPPWLQGSSSQPAPPGETPAPAQTPPPSPQPQAQTQARVVPPPSATTSPRAPFAPRSGPAGRAPAGTAAAPRIIAPPVTADGNPRVALLLPLSGANGGLGRAMLNAAQLALFDFAERHFELLIQDTGGTPDGAARAAAMAIGDGATLILGPLLATEVRAVAPAARAAGVNVIAFSSDRSVAGDGVFVMGFLPGAEIDRVVDFARDKGITRIAALAPDDPYGATIVGALRDAARDVGVMITQVAFYDPGAADFSAVVRDVADYRSRRATLLEQRAALEGRDDDIARQALRRLQGLETFGGVPFQALLLADGGKRLQQIAALLPYYDIDPKRIRMLGTGQWEVPGIGAEPAMVGGWFAAPPPEARAAFEQRYQEVYGTKAPRLSTLAYDATALAAVLAQGAGDGRFSAAAISSPRGYAGRDGIFRFRTDGAIERGLAVLQVRERDFELVGPAPESFTTRVSAAN